MSELIRAAAADVLGGRITAWIGALLVVAVVAGMVFGGVPAWLLIYLAVLGVVSVVVGRRRVARGERLLAAARVTAPTTDTASMCRGVHVE